MYVIAYKGTGNESGMFDVTEICFTSLVQSSVCLSVCACGRAASEETRGRSCHTTRTAYVRSGFCFGVDGEWMPEEQVWSRSGRTAGTATVPSCFWWFR